MSKYLVTISMPVTRYLSYVVEADSQREAEINWISGEFSDGWDEPSEDIHVETSEEITD